MNEKLSREQVFFITFLGILGNIIYIHTWIDNDTDRAAWVASLIGISATIPFAVWMMYLGKLRPELTMFDMIKDGLCKVICWLMCLLFIAVNISVSATHLNMYTAMLKVFFLQYTPPTVIMFFVVLIAFLVVNSGALVIGKLVGILTVIGLSNYFLSFSFAFPKMINIKYIYPIFDASITGLAKGCLFMCSSASEVLLLFMIFVSSIPDPYKHRKWVINGILIANLIFSLGILMIMAMLSPELAKRIAFGGVNAARLIKVGSYIHGLEVFVMGTYQFLAIGKVILCLYCSWGASKSIFGEKKPMLQMVILSLAILVTSVMINSYTIAYFLAVFMGRFVMLPFTILVLILAAIGVKRYQNRIGGV